VHLSGRNLQTEIVNCSMSPKTCKLTIDYPNKLVLDKKIVDTVELDTNAVLKNILNNAIYPTVTQKIRTTIYNPVYQCIKKL
jgi:hypothetical protein